MLIFGYSAWQDGCHELPQQKWQYNNYIYINMGFIFNFINYNF